MKLRLAPLLPEPQDRTQWQCRYADHGEARRDIADSVAGFYKHGTEPFHAELSAAQRLRATEGCRTAHRGIRH